MILHILVIQYNHIILREIIHRKLKKMIVVCLQALDHPVKPLLIFFVILLSFLFVIISRCRHRPYPPGPKGWPVIGNMDMLDQLTCRGLANLAKQYGGIFHLRMGFLHMVVVSSPEMAREVLQLQDNIFSNRPANIATSYLTYNRADLVFAHYGPFWRQMRKLCIVKLLSRKKTESWDSVRDEVDHMIRAVASSSGNAVNIGELFFGLTNNIIYRSAFGTSLDEGQEEFIKIIHEFSELFLAFNISDFIPCLGWVDPQGLNSRLARARDSLDKFIDPIIDDHLLKKKGGTVEYDMVDELLAFYSDDDQSNVTLSSTGDLQNSIKLSRNNIKAIIMDLMFGATETVASTIEWVMAELMRNTNDLKKVQQELTNIVGLSRKVEQSDFQNLIHFRCCLKEVLRLHPPVPLLLHETSQAAVVSGYHIPAKSRIMINTWAIGHDKSVWDDADEFKPARFLKDDAPDFKGRDFEFIPFGSGRRSCPGMQLGLYALEMATAHLLHSFSWELPDGMKPNDVDMNDVFGLSAKRATRLVAVPTPRLLCPL